MSGTYDATNDYWLDWIQTAKIGDKVQCIETWQSETGYGAGDEIGPVAGHVYTIREIGYLAPFYGQILCLRLCEIANQRRNYFHHEIGSIHDYEAAFKATRFRPLQSRPTEISIFTDMLKTAPAPIEEMA